MVSVAYVGGRGLYNWRVVDINQPAIGAVAANPGKNVNYLRPYRGYSFIQQEQSNGSSRYNSFQLHGTVRSQTASWSSWRIRWQRAWTTAQTIAISFPIPMTQPVCGVLRNTIRATLSCSTTLYALPFFKNQNQLAGKLLGGWQLSGNVQFQSGTPCGIGSTKDYAGVGEVGSFGCGSEGQFYTMNGKPKLTKQFAGYSGQTGKWFSTTQSGWLERSLRRHRQTPSFTRQVFATPSINRDSRTGISI